VETWAVLLRGINVGGKRPVPMAALREAFAGLGYVDPETYIQSGNVVVGSRKSKGARTTATVERRLGETFGHDLRVVVRTLPEMSAIVRRIPKDWDPDDRSTRHNVMFLTDALDARSFVRGVKTKPDLESIAAGPHVVYWSAPFATLTRTEMVKMSANPAYAEMTVRNLRTTLRIHEMMRARLSR
jgi:uncharacterized protein (DUF1697 family)